LPQLYSWDSRHRIWLVARRCKCPTGQSCWGQRLPSLSVVHIPVPCFGRRHPRHRRLAKRSAASPMRRAWLGHAVARWVITDSARPRIPLPFHLLPPLFAVPRIIFRSAGRQSSAVAPVLVCALTAIIPCASDDEMLASVKTVSVPIEKSRFLPDRDVTSDGA
jgi:hypothetical protein